MARVLLIAFLLIIGLSANTQNNNYGLGIMVGEPTGINFKSWTSNTTAYDIGLGWSFVNPSAINVHADYLFHNFNIFNVPPEHKLPLYYGIGGRAKFAEDLSIGIRVPVGAAYFFHKDEFEVYLEIAPILDIITKVEFRINSNLGLRYYFK